MRLPQRTEVEAELARRGPPLDNSPEALARVVEILVEAHALPAAVAATLRAAGYEIPDEGIYEMRCDGVGAAQLEEGP